MLVFSVNEFFPECPKCYRVFEYDDNYNEEENWGKSFTSQNSDECY